MRAAATVICCPATARTASSNGSQVPGTRSPGRAAASGPSAAATAAGSQPRSNAGFTLASTAGTARASDGDSDTDSASRRGALRTSIVPVCVAPRDSTASVRRYVVAVTASTPPIARAARKPSIAAKSYGGRYASSNTSGWSAADGPAVVAPPPAPATRGVAAVPAARSRPGFAAVEAAAPAPRCGRSAPGAIR